MFINFQPHYVQTGLLICQLFWSNSASLLLLYICYKTGQYYSFCLTENHALNHQPSIGVMACFNVWLASSHNLLLNRIKTIFISEERGSLTAQSTWYCDQKPPEATAVTGFRRSFCQKNNMNQGDKFYQLFNCWLANSETRNNNIKLSLIILGMRVQSKMLFISAANFEVF